MAGVIQDVEAAWEPIISRDTYDALLLHFKINGRTQPGRKPSHVGTGIIFCGVCGDTMRTGTSAGKPTYKCKRKADQKAETYGDGSRHVTIQTQYVEEVIRTEIINAFFSGSNVLSKSTSEGKDLTELHIKIHKLEAKRQELLDALADPDSPWTRKDIDPKVRALNNSLDALQATVDALTAEKAHAAMLDQIRRSMAFLDAGTHRVDEDAVVAIRTALGERYDSLSLSTKKTLVKDLLEVTILPKGRGAKKVKIIHRVVTSLNDEEAELAA